MTKAEKSIALISTCLARSRWPAVLWSGGKDSMVLLHLVRNVMPGVPVIFHAETAAWTPKYDFIRHVTALWNLTVYDFQPARVVAHRTEADIEFLNYYQHGARPLMIPTRVTESGDRPLCALEDIYLRPQGGLSNYRWDCIFHGAKSSDTDPIMGTMAFGSDVSLGAPCFAFPLREWTDADVWEYTDAEFIPVHSARYEKVAGGWRERDSKEFSPDLLHACTRCMGPGKEAVQCPRLGCTVANVSPQLIYEEPLRPTYLEG